MEKQRTREAEEHNCSEQEHSSPGMTRQSTQMETKKAGELQATPCSSKAQSKLGKPRDSTGMPTKLIIWRQPAGVVRLGGGLMTVNKDETLLQSKMKAEAEKLRRNRKSHSAKSIMHTGLTKRRTSG